jgi:hypothetical protein
MMYVPQKYTASIMELGASKPLKLLHQLNAEMTADGSVEDCKDLLDWLRVAVTRSTADNLDPTSNLRR